MIKPKTSLSPTFLILVIVFPLIITFIFMVSVFGNPLKPFGEIFSFRGKLTIIETDFPTISEIIYYLICSYQVIVTGIFSYLLLKLSRENYNLEEELKNIEKNRDNRILKENAVIVYYDLLLGLNDLEKLYLCIEPRIQDLKPRRLHFSQDWIKNVALLQNNLSKEEIKTCYTMYGELLAIKDFLENKITKTDYIHAGGEPLPKQEQIYDPVIYEMIKDLFNRIFNKSLWSEYLEVRDKTELSISFLKPEFQILFEKLSKISGKFDE